MSRPLPLCGWCGNPLAGESNRILVRFSSIKGRPEVGWHMVCVERDSLSKSALNSQDSVQSQKEILRGIMARVEPGRVDQRWRVVAVSKWGEKGGPRYGYKGGWTD